MTLADSSIAVLRDVFSSRKDAVVAFTRALVEAESPSGDEAGSKAVVSLLAAAAEAIPDVTKIERIASENYGEHLRVKAFGDSPKSKAILILGHTDTVHPRGSL